MLALSHKCPDRPAAAAAYHKVPTWDASRIIPVLRAYPPMSRKARSLGRQSEPRPGFRFLALLGPKRVLYHLIHRNTAPDVPIIHEAPRAAASPAHKSMTYSLNRLSLRPFCHRLWSQTAVTAKQKAAFLLVTPGISPRAVLHGLRHLHVWVTQPEDWARNLRTKLQRTLPSYLD